MVETRKTVAFGVVAATALVVAFLLFTPAGLGPQDVTPERSAELVSQGIRVIDVRTPAEFEAGHIPGAQNVPMNVFSRMAVEWDPSEPLLIYCATGARSADAVRLLADADFAEVYHLAAGIVAWDGQVAYGPGETVPAVEPSVGDGPAVYVFTTDW